MAVLNADLTVLPNVITSKIPKNLVVVVDQIGEGLDGIWGL